MDKNTLKPHDEVIESPAKPEKGFDLRSQIRDARTGRIIREQNYLRHCDRDRGTVYERDGQFWYENGEAAKGWAPVVDDKPIARAPQKETGRN